MKKIIHFSDMHIGFENLKLNLEDIITRVIFTKKPAENYVVVITGDIVEDATKKGSYQQASTHLDRLKEAGFQLLVVPGNHDYGTGSLGSSKFVKKFKMHYYKNTSISYPKLDVIDNIAFIGLDSIAQELHWYDRIWAQGELGKKQLKRLDQILNSDKVKSCEYTVVYLHHHPFDPWPLHQLKDSNKLQHVLEGHKIDTLLFGHNHNGRIWNGCWGIKRIYDAGSSTSKNGKPHPHRVIDLSKETIFDYDAEF